MTEGRGEAVGVRRAPTDLHASDPSSEKLRIVHDELNRQVDVTRARHESMFQWAAVLIGAATLVAGAQDLRISDAVHQLAVASRPHAPLMSLLLAAGATFFALVSAIMAVMAAGWGIRVLLVDRGSEIDPKKLAVNALESEGGLYAVEWSLVADKLAVHLEDKRRLELRRQRFVTGSRLLAVAWVFFLIQVCLSTPGASGG